MLKRLLKKLWIYIKPFLNWRFLVCFLIPWSITNGIWYLGFYIGTVYKIAWLASVCGSYLVWLYMPWACEKLLIIPIALWLCKILFKNHEKTRNDLNNMLAEAKGDLKTVLQKTKKIWLDLGGKTNARKRTKRYLKRRASRYRSARWSS